MDTRAFIEIFGTLASVVVAVSLTMRNIKRLRVLNMVGAAMFTAYGALIGSLPVWLLNGFIVGIDAWYLWRLLSARSHFKTMRVDVRSDYTLRFLEFHRSDIARFNPGFALLDGVRHDAYFILRDMIPVGLVIVAPSGPDEVDIVLDYAIPNYRDLKNSEYFFSQAAREIAAERPVRFRATSSSPAHTRYLERTGFRRVGERPGPGGKPVAAFERLVDATTLHGF